MADPITPAEEFGQHLSALHEQDGRSYGEMSRTLLVHAHIQISDQQLRNYHAGTVDPRRVRGQVLWALCRFYGREAAALGPVAAAEIAAMMDLASSDEVFDRTGWLSGTAA